MTTTTNLELIYMESGQVDKEGVYNDSIDRLDSILAGQLTKDLTSDADYTLSTVNLEHDNLVIKITDTGTYLTQGRNIIVPDLNRQYVAWNNTGGGYSLTFKTSGGTGIAIADGEKKLVYCDGVNVQLISGLQSLEYPVDLQYFHPGITSNSELIFLYPISRQTEFPENLTGSHAIAGTAATGSSTFSIKKNGVEFATLNFAGAATIATFTAASATTFSPGDYLSVVAPGSADGTLADIGFTFKVSNLAV